jgi:hypothetical protein
MKFSVRLLKSFHDINILKSIESFKKGLSSADNKVVGEREPKPTLESEPEPVDDRH